MAGRDLFAEDSAPQTKTPVTKPDSDAGGIDLFAPEQMAKQNAIVAKKQQEDNANAAQVIKQAQANSVRQQRFNDVRAKSDAKREAAGITPEAPSDGFFETALKTLAGLSPVTRVYSELSQHGYAPQSDLVDSSINNADDFRLGALQGATFGFADEAGGAVSALTGGDYTKARDQLRETFAAHEKRSPDLTIAGNLTGALATAPLMPEAAGAEAVKLAEVMPKVRYGQRLRSTEQAAAGGRTIGTPLSTADRELGTVSAHTGILHRLLPTTTHAASAVGQGAAAGVGSSDAPLFSNRSLEDAVVGGAFGLGVSAIPLIAQFRKKGAKDVIANAAYKYFGKDNPEAINKVLKQYDDMYKVADPVLDAEGKMQKDAEGKVIKDVNLADLSMFDDLTRNSSAVGAPTADIQSGLATRTANRRKDIVQGKEIGEGDNVQTLGGVDPEYSAQGGVLDNGYNPVLDENGQQIPARIGNVSTDAPILSRNQYYGDSEAIQPNAGLDVTGQPINDANLDQRGLIDLDALASESRKTANARAKDLYDDAYSNDGTAAKFREVTDFVKKSPTLKKLYNKGVANAKDALASQGITGKPSLVRILDETGRAINKAMQNPETTASKANLIRFKDRIDSFADDITPSLSEARSAAREGQGAADAIKEGQTILQQPEDVVASRVGSQTPTENEMTTTSAGRSLRRLISDNVKKGTRTEEGRLLGEAQVANYNRLINAQAGGNIGAEDTVLLNGLVGSEAATHRTEMLSSMTPKALFEDLRSKAPAFARSSGALFAVYSLIVNPNAIMAGLASTRIGQATVTRLPKAKLTKEVQKEVYRLGLTRTDLRNVLTGNIDRVDEGKLIKFGRKLASGIGVAGAAENSYKKSKDGSALGYN